MKQKDFKIEIIEDQVHILRCFIFGGGVVIPREIDGKQVTQICLLYTSNELNDETMKSVLEEQRQWIKEKETAVSEAKALVSGGSAEIMNANMTGGELTRSRVYELLEYLP